MRAYSIIKGNSDNPEVSGRVTFRQCRREVLVTADIKGLPKNSSFHGFHIHEGISCTGDESDEFKNALTHLNPEGLPHPKHEGDMPPLLSSCGRVYTSFMTDRFSVKDIVGKVVIIHSGPDDFTTQIGGNSGEKIACGKIISSGR